MQLSTPTLPLADLADYFHELGFNLSAISPELGSGSRKAPYHEWKKLLSARQTKEEVRSFQWDRCTGMGAFSGINSIRCIDIDECASVDFIYAVLAVLELPQDYEWVIRSGKGFHVWVICEGQPEEAAKTVYKHTGKTGQPFHHLELRWNQHTVLPPSLHENGKRYEFLNTELPGNSPQLVSVRSVQQVVKSFCESKEAPAPEAKADRPAGNHTVDEYSLFEYAVSFTSEKITFAPSQRNDFVHKLACNCNRYGIPVELVVEEAKSRYAEAGFSEREIAATVKSAYSNNRTEAGKYRDLVLTRLIGGKEQEAAEEQPADEAPEEITADVLLNRKVEKVPTLIDPIFPRIGLAAIAGSSDTGKSSWLRQLAMAVCSGDKDFLGFEIQAQHRSAIYVSTEDDETAISYLLNKQNKGKGYAPTAYKGLRYLFDLGNDLVKELDKRLKRKPADLIIIDAFTDLYGKNMNESNQVRFFLNDYSQLAQKHQCLIVFLHHTGKRTEEQAPSKHNLLGSQAFEAKMRLVIELRVDYHNPEIRHLCVVKGNYLPAELKQESFVLRFDEHMLFHSTGERASFDELIKPQDQGDSGTDLKDQAVRMREAGQSVRAIAASLGKSVSTIHAWTKSVRSSEHTNDSERTNAPFD